MAYLMKDLQESLKHYIAISLTLEKSVLQLQ
jgi:hypothetical protein